jgi:hypothetical protein
MQQRQLRERGLFHGPGSRPANARLAVIPENVRIFRI